jgi:hypothetical protein
LRFFKHYQRILRARRVDFAHRALYNEAKSNFAPREMVFAVRKKIEPIQILPREKWFSPAFL